jgi:hypothetical protein
MSDQNKVDDGWDLCCQRAGQARLLRASAALCEAAGSMTASSQVRLTLLGVATLLGKRTLEMVNLSEATFLVLARSLDNGDDYAQEMLREVKEHARTMRGQLALPIALEPGPTTSLHGEIEAEARRLGSGLGKTESLGVLVDNIGNAAEMFQDDEALRDDPDADIEPLPRREDLLTIAAWAYLALKRETDHPGAASDEVPEASPVSPDANPQMALPLTPADAGNGGPLAVFAGSTERPAFVPDVVFEGIMGAPVGVRGRPDGGVEIRTSSRGSGEGVYYFGGTGAPIAGFVSSREPIVAIGRR